MTRSQDSSLGVVVVAAGTGQRFGDSGKIFRLLGGQPVLQHSLRLFLSMPEVQALVVVLGAHTLDEGRMLLHRMECEDVHICLGGDTRSDSVRAGIAALPASVDLVAVHDAGRPLARADMVRRVIEAARKHGAAIPITPVSDTIVRLRSDQSVDRVESRDQLGAVQTPQVARRDWLVPALDACGHTTDEGGALLAAGYPVTAVDGSPDNIKLTWPDDLAVAEVILMRRRQ